jgi:hypothetical protein
MEKPRIDVESTIGQVHAYYLIFGVCRETTHGFCELVGFERSVQDREELGTSYCKTVHDHIDNLCCVDKVASRGHLLQIDAESVDALEPSGHVFDGLKV